MKRLLFTLIVCFLLSSCKGKPSPDDLNEVYICTSEGAKAYHAKEDCEGISNCSQEIRKVNIEEVELLRKPCSMCVKKNKSVYTNSYNKTESIKLNREIFIDILGKVHTDRECSAIDDYEDIENLTLQNMEFVKGMCEECVDAFDYDANLLIY